MDYFISDIHFGDYFIFKHQKRPFVSVNDMNESIIKRWNEKVTDKDDIWIVGDMISHSKQSNTYYLRQLNGIKHLIVGNHDYYLIRDNKARNYFESIDNYKAFRMNDGYMVVLSHYPIAEWNGFYRNTYHIYGHIHNQKSNSAIYMAGLERALSADIVINQYQPASFMELIENNKKYKAQMFI